MSDTQSDTITISRKEYDSMLDDVLFLNCLRAAGVDNWEWYGEAIDQYNEQRDSED